MRRLVLLCLALAMTSTLSACYGPHHHRGHRRPGGYGYGGQGQGGPGGPWMGGRPTGPGGNWGDGPGGSRSRY